jgi:hypothetical protein
VSDVADGDDVNAVGPGSRSEDASGMKDLVIPVHARAADQLYWCHIPQYMPSDPSTAPANGFGHRIKQFSDTSTRKK